MQRLHKVAMLATVAGAAALHGAAAQAADGQITSFGASALQVLAGGWVDFELHYSLTGSSSIEGGSNLNEPSPVEGYQEWLLNWYRQEWETPQSVTLQVAGQSFTDLPTVERGSNHSGSWSFRLMFPVAGSFDIAAAGEWSALRLQQQGSEIGTRYCYNTGDPESGVNLSCDGWNYSYPQFEDSNSVGGALTSATLRIEVKAVPEPATVALWLLGAGLLAARLRQV